VRRGAAEARYHCTTNNRVWFIQTTFPIIFFITVLKVVCNKNQGGSGRWHVFGIGIGSWRSMFFCRLILLSSLFLCISVSAK
jgi:hypothetical protein